MGNVQSDRGRTLELTERAHTKIKPKTDHQKIKIHSKFFGYGTHLENIKSDIIRGHPRGYRAAAFCGNFSSNLIAEILDTLIKNLHMPWRARSILRHPDEYRRRIERSLEIDGGTIITEEVYPALLRYIYAQHPRELSFKLNLRSSRAFLEEISAFPISITKLVLDDSDLDNNCVKALVVFIENSDLKLSHLSLKDCGLSNRNIDDLLEIYYVHCKRSWIHHYKRLDMCLTGNNNGDATENKLLKLGFKELKARSTKEGQCVYRNGRCTVTVDCWGDQATNRFQQHHRTPPPKDSRGPTPGNSENPASANEVNVSVVSIGTLTAGTINTGKMTVEETGGSRSVTAGV